METLLNKYLYIRRKMRSMTKACYAWKSMVALFTLKSFLTKNSRGLDKEKFSQSIRKRKLLYTGFILSQWIYPRR